MRRLALIALLLSSAAAQTPATPATARSALPALPAPAQVAPVVVPTPAAHAPVLSLSAPVGTTVELLSTQSQTISGDVKVDAAPGHKFTAAELEAARQQLLSGMGSSQLRRENISLGKVFYKVVSRDQSGTGLMINWIRNVPGQAPTNLKVTQFIAPDGTITLREAQSNDPGFMATIQSLTKEKLKKYVQQGYGSFDGLYNQPLTPGQPVENQLTLDMGPLVSALMNLGAGEDSPEIPTLLIKTTSFYQGKGPQGHRFVRNGRFDQWGFTGSMPLQNGETTTTEIELLGGTMNAVNLMRDDGMPIGGEQQLSMKLRMKAVVEGLAITVTMNIEQTMTLKPR